MKKVLSLSLLLVLIAVIFYACKKDDDGGTPSATQPKIALIKTATSGTHSAVGDTINYEFTVTNTGNVALTDVIVEDPLVTVSGGPIALVTGASNSTNFTASYIITQADVISGSVTNQAMATGNAPLGVIVTDLSDPVSNDSDNPTVTPVISTYRIIKMATNHGDIFMWLYDDTPLHKHNFDSLTTSGFYDGLIFHRVIDDFVIQGGDPLGNGTGGPGYTIAAEFVPGITHVEGAVGAARNNNPEKRSNGSQFYIVEDPNGEHGLDGNYTVFGLTIGGMDVVRNIAEVPTNSNDKPLTDVVMTKVEVVEYTAEELLTMFGFTVPN